MLTRYGDYFIGKQRRICYLNSRFQPVVMSRLLLKKKNTERFVLYTVRGAQCPLRIFGRQLRTVYYVYNKFFLHIYTPYVFISDGQSVILLYIKINRFINPMSNPFSVNLKESFCYDNFNIHVCCCQHLSQIIVSKYRILYVFHTIIRIVFA